MQKENNSLKKREHIYSLSEALTFDADGNFLTKNRCNKTKSITCQFGIYVLSTIALNYAVRTFSMTSVTDDCKITMTDYEYCNIGHNAQPWESLKEH